MRQRLGELEATRRAKLDELTALKAEHSPPAADHVDLLDELPLADVNLIDVPDEHLRRPFEGFPLQVRYDPATHHATVQVTIADDTLDGLDTSASPLLGDSDRDTATEPGNVSHVLGGPQPYTMRTFPH